ncbi:MAG TPA: isoprenylcysteine carboxylmethyltransferase family protein [Alphaproteobacteria bacterium]|nr:isoprenylcysteine carboxylmethyltransferase family protein [Alphaproteobacteria bacterium]
MSSSEADGGLGVSLTESGRSPRSEPVAPQRRPLSSLDGERLIDLGARIFVAVFFTVYGLPDFLGAISVSREIVTLGPTPPAIAKLLSLASLGSFMLLVAWLALVRLRPLAKSAGLAPRLAAFFGTVLPMIMFLFPVRANLSLAEDFTASIVTFAGTALALCILRQLGRSFSIMPEARRLVTTGAYAVVRHPLYWAEFVCCLGVFIRYASVAALVIMAAQVAFQLVRIGYEERVLRRVFPEYAAYSRRTARLIPGVY